MRVVIQRVLEAKVEADQYKASIGKGYLILLGIHVNDQIEDYNYILRKIISLRIFDDAEGKMNLSLSQVNGSILLVSQFTLFGSVKGNNRPSFIESAKPEKAIPFYNQMILDLKQTFHVETGVFGANMQVSLINDGPVTIIIDSKEA